MDEAGFETAHIVGNSLGGFLALKLAERGRARSVVALAPAGGWADGSPGFAGAREYFVQMLAMVKAAAPHVDAIVATPEGRRQATAAFTTNYEHIPPELVAHVLVGAARCDAAVALLDYALEAGWDLDGEKVTCPGPLRLGHRRPGPALSVGRRPLPRVGPGRGVGRARRDRPLPAARRPGRDRGADPRLQPMTTARRPVP